MSLSLPRPVVVLAPVAVLVVALAMFTNVLPFREILAQRQEIASAQARLESLEETNQALEAQVEALHTPLEIERLAREQLGYVRPGEEAFVAMEPEQPATQAETPAPAEGTTEPAEHTWWQRIWDYLTGRDLSAGG